MNPKPKTETVLPKKFEFSMGGWGDAQEVCLADNTLVCGTMYEPPDRRKKFTPTPQQWREFWREIEASGVWQWESYYDNTNVLDGTQWSLQIEHGPRKLTSEGSNAYPGSTGMEFPPTSSFGQFLQALQNLVGQNLFPGL
jgi:hypothetical protein